MSTQQSLSRHTTPLVHTILTLCFYSASLLKQQSSCRHATPLVHTILTLCFYSAILLKQQSCGLWVQTSVRSKPRPKLKHICCFSTLKHTASRSKSKYWLSKDSRHATPLVHTILTLCFYSASLLKQQSSSRHATPLVHTILTLCF
jgi:hypothetical protein